MKKKTTPSERMREVLSALGINAYDFESKCGMGHGFVSRVTRVITKKQRVKIKLAFPMINIDYVTTGIGDMFMDKEHTAPPTIKERIRTFRDYMNVSDAEFCRKAGLAESFTKNMSDNVRGMSLEKIYKAFPRLNPQWLEYGEGDMLIEESQLEEKTANYRRIDELIDFLGVTKSQFTSETDTNEYYSCNQKDLTKKTADKIIKRYPFVNPVWLMHGRGEMINTPSPANVRYAPFVSTKEEAYPDKCTDKRYLKKLPQYPYIQSGETEGDMVAFEMSANRIFTQGDIVLCRELNKEDYKMMPLPFKHYDFILVSDRIEVGHIEDHDTERSMITFNLRRESLSSYKKVFVAITRISSLMH